MNQAILKPFFCILKLRVAEIKISKDEIGMLME
jgi:hypothetical protein